MGDAAPCRANRFPTSFLRGCGEIVSQAVDLAYEGEYLSITVARQHRTHTGFAFMPSHPGEKHLRDHIELQGL
jgi:hypothetical protein